VTPDDPEFWLGLAKSAPAILVALVWAEVRVRPLVVAILGRERAQERLTAELAVRSGISPERVRALLDSGAA